MCSVVNPENRIVLHTRLKEKADCFKAVTDFGEISLRTAEIILQLHLPNLSADKPEIVKTVRVSFPLLNQVFNDKLISNPLSPTSLSKDILEFYDVSPITPNFLAEVGIQDINKINRNYAILVEKSKRKKSNSRLYATSLSAMFVWWASVTRMPKNFSHETCITCS